MEQQRQQQQGQTMNVTEEKRAVSGGLVVAAMEKENDANSNNHNHNAREGDDDDDDDAAKLPETLPVDEYMWSLRRPLDDGAGVATNCTFLSTEPSSSKDEEGDDHPDDSMVSRLVEPFAALTLDDIASAASTMYNVKYAFPPLFWKSCGAGIRSTSPATYLVSVEPNNNNSNSSMGDKDQVETMASTMAPESHGKDKVDDKVAEVVEEARPFDASTNRSKSSSPSCYEEGAGVDLRPFVGRAFTNKEELVVDDDEAGHSFGPFVEEEEVVDEEEGDLDPLQDAHNGRAGTNKEELVVDEDETGDSFGPLVDSQEGGCTDKEEEDEVVDKVEEDLGSIVEQNRRGTDNVAMPTSTAKESVDSLGHNTNTNSNNNNNNNNNKTRSVLPAALRREIAIARLGFRKKKLHNQIQRDALATTNGSSGSHVATATSRHVATATSHVATATGNNHEPPLVLRARDLLRKIHRDKKKKVSAVLIQAAWRRLRARRATAAGIIQAWWRTRQEVEEQARDLLRKIKKDKMDTVAAVLIQAAWRAWRSLCARRVTAAGAIQAWWRTLQEEHEKDSSKKLVLQVPVRQVLSTQEKRKRMAIVHEWGNAHLLQLQKNAAVMRRASNQASPDDDEEEEDEEQEEEEVDVDAEEEAEEEEDVDVEEAEDDDNDDDEEQEEHEHLPVQPPTLVWPPRVGQRFTKEFGDHGRYEGIIAHVWFDNKSQEDQWHVYYYEDSDWEDLNIEQLMGQNIEWLD